MAGNQPHLGSNILSGTMTSDEARSIIYLIAHDVSKSNLSSSSISTADLSEVLNIPESEVQSLLNKIRSNPNYKQQPDQVGPLSLTMVRAMALPIGLILIFGLILLSVSSQRKSEPKRMAKAQKERPSSQLILASMEVKPTTTMSFIPAPPPAPYLAPPPQSDTVSNNIYQVKYLSPDEVNRKCNVFVNSFEMD